MSVIVKNSKGITAVLLLVCFFVFVGRVIEKDFNRYHKATASLKSLEVEVTVRLMGTSRSYGTVAVGSPYTLFVSIYPELDDLVLLSVDLIAVNETKAFHREEKIPLLKEKVYGKEGNFLYYSKVFDEMEYKDYILNLSFYVGDKFYALSLDIERDHSVRREFNLWRRLSSV